MQKRAQEQILKHENTFCNPPGSTKLYSNDDECNYNSTGGEPEGCISGSVYWNLLENRPWNSRNPSGLAQNRQTSPAFSVTGCFLKHSFRNMTKSSVRKETHAPAIWVELFVPPYLLLILNNNMREWVVNCIFIEFYGYLSAMMFGELCNCGRKYFIYYWLSRQLIAE